MISGSSNYALVVNGKVIAKGNAKAMRKLKKQTPDSRVWLTSAPVGAEVK